MKRTGFTLIELLVVIANLRQLAQALTVYDLENGTFPYGFDDSAFGTVIPPGGYPGSHTHDKMGWWWFHSLVDIRRENFDKGTIFWCPSRCIRDPFPKANVLCGNYGVNRSVCRNAPGITGIVGSEFVGTPLGLHEIRQPAETLLITDSGYSLISWQGTSDTSGPFFDNPR
ncbi:MAG: type II secretion system protein, partial [Planctomycetota bacterium]